MKKNYTSVEHKKIPLFKDVTNEEWNDWKWQIRNAIRDVETLEKVIKITDEERTELKKCLTKFRMAITPYYAALMDKTDPECPVRKQAVPSIQELHDDPSDLDDPLDEDVDSPTPGLTHRYPDRALMLVTNVCSMYCRHCTRRRVVGFDDSNFSQINVDKAIEYIKKTPVIRDVIVSGGDPFVLSDDKLEYVLKKLREIDHVEIIRLGSRMPVVLPQRITDDLVNMIRKYHPVYVNTHFNHYKEITAESKKACEKLADGGINMGNQSVLLNGINDCPQTMKRLLHELLMIRVKPYYIYQCDLSRGISHFRTTVSRGIEIIENLRGHTTGMAVPTFVVDAPGGGGKIPVMPSYLISQSNKYSILRNYEGVITTYAEPSGYTPNEIIEDEKYKSKDGLALLLNGEKLTLQPEGLVRRKRKKNEEK
jgi:lysine 2,3-aminomutase